MLPFTNKHNDEKNIICTYLSQHWNSPCQVCHVCTSMLLFNIKSNFSKQSSISASWNPPLIKSYGWTNPNLLSSGSVQHPQVIWASAPSKCKGIWGIGAFDGAIKRVFLWWKPWWRTGKSPSLVGKSPLNNVGKTVKQEWWYNGENHGDQWCLMVTNDG